MDSKEYPRLEKQPVEDALRRSESKYRNLIETMSEGFALHEIIFDLRGEPCDYRFLEVNPAFLELTGLPADIVGKSIRDVLPNIGSAWVENCVRVALKCESTHFENYSPPLKRWYEVYAYCPQKGQFATLCRDITERKQAEEGLKRKTIELQVTNHELEAFSYSISHDLRSPLRALDGFSQVLLEDYSAALDEKGKEYLGYIRSSSQVMAQLIEDILRLSRVNRLEIMQEKINLSQLADESAAEIKKRNADRKIDFQIQPDLFAQADRRLVRLVLDNLLGNAVKFTSKTSRPCIEFGVEANSKPPVFFVRDNGCGFDMTYVDRLFKPFQRLHSAADYPGTGIGLALVLRIINRLGGRVWAQGEVGRGAAFYFALKAG